MNIISKLKCRLKNSQNVFYIRSLHLELEVSTTHVRVCVCSFGSRFTLCQKGCKSRGQSLSLAAVHCSQDKCVGDTLTRPAEAAQHKSADGQKRTLRSEQKPNWQLLHSHKAAPAISSLTLTVGSDTAVSLSTQFSRCRSCLHPHTHIYSHMAEH